MGKRSQNALQQLYVPAEVQAAEDLGISLTSEFVRRLRGTIQQKAKQVKEAVQYYAIIDDAIWTPQEIDDRIFAATRLLYEYQGPSGCQVGRRAERIEALKQLILRLAALKKNTDLPIVKKIMAEELESQGPEPAS